MGRGVCAWVGGGGGEGGPGTGNYTTGYLRTVDGGRKLHHGVSAQGQAAYLGLCARMWRGGGPFVCSGGGGGAGWGGVGWPSLPVQQAGGSGGA